VTCQVLCSFPKNFLRICEHVVPAVLPLLNHLGFCFRSDFRQANEGDLLRIICFLVVFSKSGASATAQGLPSKHNINSRKQ
jgi:hypothetical protein